MKKLHSNAILVGENHQSSNNKILIIDSPAYYIMISGILIIDSPALSIMISTPEV